MEIDCLKSPIVFYKERWKVPWVAFSMPKRLPSFVINEKFEKTISIEAELDGQALGMTFCALHD